MKRKLLVVLLALAMLVTLTPMAVYAADDTQYPHWSEDGTQYIVDDIGNVAKGITEIEGNYYYFDEDDGHLYKGQPFSVEKYVDELYYYYTDEDGALQEGWVTDEIGNTYYFRDQDGYRRFSAYTSMDMVVSIDDAPYYFDDEGVLYKGLFSRPTYNSDDEIIYDYYYADKETGILQTGWQEIDGNTYCFYEDNYFAYAGGTYTIDGESYTFDEDGVLIDEPSYDPELVPETLWLGEENYKSPVLNNVDNEIVEVSDVTSSDPSVIEVVLSGEGSKTWDYILEPKSTGTADISVEFEYNGNSYTLTEEYEVKAFPKFIGSLEVDGETQAAADYEGINYYYIHEYTGTAPSVKLEPADGWVLNNGYGFTGKDDDESAGINFEIDPDEIENGWTFDFPEDYDYLCTFYYFSNADTSDEIMFSVQFYRDKEGGGDGPIVPSAGHWDESHTHYYYDYGLATGLSCIEEDGKYKLYYFDEKNGTLKKGWIEETGTWTDEDTGETGTWSNWYYGDPDTGELATGWKKIGSYWYYFTEVDLTEGWDGYLPDLHDYGTEKIGGKWYYLTPGSGRMGTGWIKDVNTYTDESGYTETWTTWYYAHPTTGILQTGWLNLNNKWYYLETREDWDYGAMYIGLRVINGKSYLFDRNSGVMQSGGWVKDTYTWTDGAGKTHTWSNWYYAGSNGVLAEGWRQLGGKWYYFQKGDEYGPGGYMFNNDVYRIDNKLYAFNKDGAMVTGWYQFTWEGYREDGTTVKYTEWTYANSAGIVNTGWQKVSGTWYYFDDWGYMLASDWAEDSRGLCWLEASGKLSTATKWVKYDGEWYHITKGYMDKNKWMKDSKGWCWLTEDGSMLTNGWAKDSLGWCWIGSNGYMPTTTQWIKYEGKWYHITKGYRDQNAWMKDSKGWCWLTEDGSMLTNGWAKDSIGMCWIAADGYMPVITDWVEYEGDTYYIEKGYMAVNKTIVIDGETYVFDADGHWTISEESESTN